MNRITQFLKNINSQSMATTKKILYVQNITQVQLAPNSKQQSQTNKTVTNMAYRLMLRSCFHIALYAYIISLLAIEMVV